MGLWEKLPDFVKMKPDRTGVTDRFDLNSIKTNKDHYALLFFAPFRVTEEGNYTFYIGSNDGSRLWVDNRLTIDNNGLHGYQMKQGMIALKKGEHVLMVEYFQAGAGQELKVFWKRPGGEKEPFKER